jgi:hypothetical protein
MDRTRSAEAAAAAELRADEVEMISKHPEQRRLWIYVQWKGTVVDGQGNGGHVSYYDGVCGLATDLRPRFHRGFRRFGGFDRFVRFVRFVGSSQAPSQQNATLNPQNLQNPQNLLNPQNLRYFESETVLRRRLARAAISQSTDTSRQT